MQRDNKSTILIRFVITTSGATPLLYQDFAAELTILANFVRFWLKLDRTKMTGKDKIILKDTNPHFCHHRKLAHEETFVSLLPVCPTSKIGLQNKII